jgi:hypothetical protein
MRLVDPVVTMSWTVTMFGWCSLGGLGEGVEPDALDGHLPAEERVAGAEHLAERAGAEACQWLVPLAEAAESQRSRRARDVQLGQVLALQRHPGILRSARQGRQ